MSKKDKTVVITSSGKVKLKLTGHQALQFCSFLYTAVEHYNDYIKGSSGTINGATYLNFANLALCFRLYTKHINAMNPEELKLEMSKVEAIMLWGCFNNSPYYDDAFLIDPMLKLNQKLT